jgi:hypothetical protein
MRFRRRRRVPARRPALEIMREATALRNEMRITSSVARAEEIERRMRELAVEIGALPADYPIPSEGARA